MDYFVGSIHRSLGSAMGSFPQSRVRVMNFQDDGVDGFMRSIVNRDADELVPRV